MPLAFERVCSQQPAISGKLVAAALPLIGCGFDLARKTVRGGAGVRRWGGESHPVRAEG